ncbi:hypothetical protein KAT95_01770 [Candidatus Parcubacteria bacterium]|nr:hypothetical protein [Candidatus Parcubacteria bacterium]
MSKKIFDIIPPKKESIDSILIKKKDGLSKKREKIAFLSPKKLIFLLIAFIFLGVFIHITFSKAEIEIWPEKELLSFEDNITINLNTKDSDFSNKIISGEIMEEEKEIVQEFSATGSVSKKAKGIARVYNAYSTSSQVLVATTRFVSASGKLFRTPKKIVIPGGHYEKGKLVPGQIDVEIIADQPGEDYNIEPTTFSIPGFAGSSKFTFFYAKSFSPMAGGGIVAQVTEADLENAEKALLDSLKKETKKTLLLKAEPEYYLLEKTLKQEIIESSSSIQAETEAERFNYKVKLKSKALTFKKQNLRDFVKNTISSQISADKKLHNESVQISYSIQTINSEASKVNLSLDFSANIYPALDILAFKDALSDKLFDEAKVLLENQQEITAFQIELWPFWLKKIPKDTEKIDIEIKLD